MPEEETTEEAANAYLQQFSEAHPGEERDPAQFVRRFDTMIVWSEKQLIKILDALSTSACNEQRAGPLNRLRVASTQLADLEEKYDSVSLPELLVFAYLLPCLFICKRL